MAIERRRPLPAGRYWADIFAANRPAFEAWLHVNESDQSVRVESFTAEPETDGAPSHDFVVFRTARELVWDDATLGFSPNVAAATVQSASDVTTVPTAESTLPDLSDMFATVTTRIVGVIAAVTLLGVILTRVGKK